MGTYDPDVPPEYVPAMDAHREDVQRRYDTPKQKQSGKKALRKARDAKAMEMRMNGATYPEIAEECEYPSAYAARTAVDRGIIKNFDDKADALRIVEDSNLEVASRFIMDIIKAETPLPGLERLEELLMDADRADVTRAVELVVESAQRDADMRMRAVDRLLNIGARKGKLFGYDAPTKQEISGDSGIINVVFDSAIAAPQGMDEPEIIVEPQT